MRVEIGRNLCTAVIACAFFLSSAILIVGVAHVGGGGTGDLGLYQGLAGAILQAIAGGLAFGGAMYAGKKAFNGATAQAKAALEGATAQATALREQTEANAIIAKLNARLRQQACAGTIFPEISRLHSMLDDRIEALKTGNASNADFGDTSVLRHNLEIVSVLGYPIAYYLAMFQQAFEVQEARRNDIGKLVHAHPSPDFEARIERDWAEALETARDVAKTLESLIHHCLNTQPEREPDFSDIIKRAPGPLWGTARHQK